MRLLDEHKLHPGLVIHARTKSALGWLIRRSVRSWGNHDAIVVRRRDYSLGIGDAEPPAANVKTVDWYNTQILIGKYQVKVMEPIDTPVLKQELAANWWMDNVRNSAYDYAAFPRLLLKALFGDWFPKAAGLQWANWCTEGVHHAYLRGPKKDIWRNNSPTPRTTEKRVDETLRDVTERYTKEVNHGPEVIPTQ